MAITVRIRTDIGELIFYRMPRSATVCQGPHRHLPARVFQNLEAQVIKLSLRKYKIIYIFYKHMTSSLRYIIKIFHSILAELGMLDKTVINNSNRTDSNTSHFGLSNDHSTLSEYKTQDKESSK